MSTNSFKVQVNTLTEDQFEELASTIVQLDTVDFMTALTVASTSVAETKEIEKKHGDAPIFFGVNNRGGCSLHLETAETFEGVPTVDFDAAVSILSQITAA